MENNRKRSLGSVAGSVSRRLARPAVRSFKNMVYEAGKWQLDVKIRFPLGEGSPVEVDEFSVRLKQASLTNDAND